jgi:hypothetical protein
MEFRPIEDSGQRHGALGFRRKFFQCRDFDGWVYQGAVFRDDNSDDKENVYQASCCHCRVSARVPLVGLGGREKAQELGILRERARTLRVSGIGPARIKVLAGLRPLTARKQVR